MERDCLSRIFYTERLEKMCYCGVDNVTKQNFPDIFMLYTLACGAINQCRAELSKQGITYYEMTSILRQALKIDKAPINENRDCSIAPLRKKFAIYCDICDFTDYNNNISSIFIFSQRALWFIERYLVKDEFKREQFSVLHPGIRLYSKNDLTLLKNKVKMEAQIYHDFCKLFAYMKKELPPNMISPVYDEEHIDKNIHRITNNYYDSIIGSLKECKKRDELDVTNSSTGYYPSAILDYYSLATYCFAFEAAYGYNLKKFFSEPSDFSAISEEYADDNGAITAKVLYDISTGLDYGFICKCRETINSIYASIDGIRNIMKLPYYLSDFGQDTQVKKFSDEIDRLVAQCPDSFGKSKYLLDEIQQFYASVLFFDIKIKLGFSNNKPQNKPYILNIAYPQMESESIIKLLTTNVCINSEKKKYRKLNLTPNIKYVSEEDVKIDPIDIV